TGAPARSRWREGGFLVNRPSSGNRAGPSRPDPLSTQGRRIAVLAVVSRGSHRATGACEWLAGRAGCLNWARPDPWEPWVGNRPGRPGKHGRLMSVLARHLLGGYPRPHE